MVRNVQHSYEPEGASTSHCVTCRQSDGYYHYSDLKNIKVPTVVLQGTADLLISEESGKDLAANIQGADLFIVPGLGHDMPLQLVPSFVYAITTAADHTIQAQHSFH